MELVDSHCHIDFEPLGDNIESVLTNAKKNHIAYMLCVSVNLADFPRVLSLAHEHKHIFASVGVHPNESPGQSVDIDKLIELGQDPQIVAVGETGLDYFRSTGDLDWQHNRFYRHIEAAHHLDKPLIIHMRDAGDDTINIMQEANADRVGGVMHCFADDWPIARRALDLGFYISFSGIVTFKSAEKIREVALKTPLDRILVETDAPYLAPVPYRGKTNEPAFVRHTAEFVANLRDMPLEDFAQQTTDNFFTLFNTAQRVH